MDARMKIPGPDHPITVRPSAAHVRVTAGGQVVADTRRALVLQEAAYPAVHYVPLEDVRTELLERTDHRTYCPYKGECGYYSLPIAGERGVNAVWEYAEPYPAVAEIRGHVAFYPDRVDALDVE